VRLSLGSETRAALQPDRARVAGKCFDRRSSLRRMLESTSSSPAPATKGLLGYHKPRAWRDGLDRRSQSGETDSQVRNGRCAVFALAKSTASGLNDASVKTALVVATAKHAAEGWLEPGAISPGAADPRAYLIVLKGRFICTHCSYPAGAKPPRGRWAQSIWIPGQRVSDFGLTQRLPGGLDKLGRVVKINLLAPAVTAPALAQAQDPTYHRCRRERLSVRGTAGGSLNLTNLRVIRIPCSGAAPAVRASSYEATPAGRSSHRDSAAVGR
jgi:hypothetical protein